VGLPLEVNAVRRDGVEFPVELSVWVTVNQGVQRVNAFVRDTSDRKALEAVTHQAFHDPLTDLANRALFTDRVAAALARRGDSATTTVAVLLLDLDDFKTVNDSLGHAAGDELLVAVATRLRSCVRPGDTLARLAGDEFAILLDELDDQNDAVAVATRVGKRLEVAVRDRGHGDRRPREHRHLARPGAGRPPRGPDAGCRRRHVRGQGAWEGRLSGVRAAHAPGGREAAWS
jgi:diguanylate cyclase (GGDEF)-like protein